MQAAIHPPAAGHLSDKPDHMGVRYRINRRFMGERSIERVLISLIRAYG